MLIPAWLAAVIAAFLLAQLAIAIRVLLALDRRLAVLESEVRRVLLLLERHELSVIRADIDALKDESKRHRAGHERNRDRVESIREELLDLHHGHAADRHLHGMGTRP